ncbi:MAG: ArsR family transcriptional regulator [Flavobacteriaceae bacterium]
MLGELITSKTRLRLLIKFFVSQANRGYLNGLAAEMGESTNSIRKELNHLQSAGYLEKVKVDNKVEYKANIQHPLFEVMRKVVLKHLGLEDIVENVLERMGDVQQIILVGDYAKGNDSGLIEVFLIGQGLNMNYISQLEDKIENMIKRKVNFYLASKFLTEREHIILFDKNTKKQKK